MVQKLSRSIPLVNGLQSSSVAKCVAGVVHIPKHSHEASTDSPSSEYVEPKGKTLGQNTLCCHDVYGAVFTFPAM